MNMGGFPTVLKGVGFQKSHLGRKEIHHQPVASKQNKIMLFFSQLMDDIHPFGKGSESGIIRSTIRFFERLPHVCTVK
jgi:hypothetical protein